MARPVLEVQLQGDQRQALLFHRADEPLDFLAVQQQLPGAHRIVVVPVSLLVGRDVHAFQEDLSVAEPRVGFLDGAPCRPEAI